jgi:hypothetical protein
MLLMPARRTGSRRTFVLDLDGVTDTAYVFSALLDSLVVSCLRSSKCETEQITVLFLARAWDHRRQSTAVIIRSCLAPLCIPSCRPRRLYLGCTNTNVRNNLRVWRYLVAYLVRNYGEEKMNLV